jgi:hypothetical protein
MVTKEDVGRGFERAARIIPGIGSYQDREALRESDKALRVALARRMEEHLGAIEWLKTDQAKKGAYKRMREIEDLSRHMEKVSRLLENAMRGYAPVLARSRVDEETLRRVYAFDQGFWGLMEEVSGLVGAMTKDRAVPEAAEIDGLRDLLSKMESRIREREAMLKDPGR